MAKNGFGVIMYESIENGVDARGNNVDDISFEELMQQTIESLIRMKKLLAARSTSSPASFLGSIQKNAQIDASAAEDGINFDEAMLNTLESLLRVQEMLEDKSTAQKNSSDFREKTSHNKFDAREVVEDNFNFDKTIKHTVDTLLRIQNLLTDKCSASPYSFDSGKESSNDGLGGDEFVDEESPKPSPDPCNSSLQSALLCCDDDQSNNGFGPGEVDYEELVIQSIDYPETVQSNVDNHSLGQRTSDGYTNTIPTISSNNEKIEIVCDNEDEGIAKQILETTARFRYNNLNFDQKIRLNTWSPIPTSWSGASNIRKLTENGIINENSALIAAIQFLSHVPGFATPIMNHNSESCYVSCLICEWKWLQFETNGSKVSNLERFTGVFESCCKTNSIEPIQTIEYYILSLCIFVNDRFMSLYDQNLIADVFGFEAQSESSCCHCGSLYTSKEHNSRQLNLTRQNGYNHLQQCIDDLFAPSLLPESECTRCGRNNMVKMNYFVRTPNVLVIMDMNHVLKTPDRPVHICKQLNIGKHAALNNLEYGKYELCGFVFEEENYKNSQVTYTTCAKQYGSKDLWTTMKDDMVYQNAVDPSIFVPRVLMYRRVVHCGRDN